MANEIRDRMIRRGLLPDPNRRDDAPPPAPARAFPAPRPERPRYRTIREVIAEQVRGYGSLQALAYAYGANPAYLADVASGRRQPDGFLLQALGVRAVTVYVEEE